MNVLSNNQQLVGRIHMEIRIRINHVLDAVDHILERQQFDLVSSACIATTTRSPWGDTWYMRRGYFERQEHSSLVWGSWGMVQGEKCQTWKKIFGDLKLILGYRHYGYRTVPGRENPWWLQRAPVLSRIIGLIKLLYRLASVGLSILTFLTYLIVCMPFYKLLVYEYSKTYVRPLQNLN